MEYPRRNNKNWKESKNDRQWVPAGRLPEWEVADNYSGIPYFVLLGKTNETSEFPSEDDEFPSEDEEVNISRGGTSKRLRVLELLDVSTSGFKCLYLVSEV